jgi:CBS domain containing-hemolysin-like protein
MRLFYAVTKPLVDFFNWLGNLVLKPFGVPPAREVGHAPHSEDELRALLRQSLAEGLIDPDEREFAENVFGFGDRRARQIMVPRREVDLITTDDSLREAAARATETGHTRLPLADPEAGLDDAIGVVNAKDILRAVMEGGDARPADLARPLKRVSESILVDELLRELREDRQHVALVVDEHGTVIGLVSLEDILEEIVGDITDEFDPDEAEMVEWRDGSLVVSGSAPIHLVATKLETDISDPNEATIGGHVLELLGRLPDPGEVVEIDGHRARVTDVEDARIVELVIDPIEADEAG